MHMVTRAQGKLLGFQTSGDAGKTEASPQVSELSWMCDEGRRLTGKASVVRKYGEHGSLRCLAFDMVFVTFTHSAAKHDSIGRRHGHQGHEYWVRRYHVQLRVNSVAASSASNRRNATLPNGHAVMLESPCDGPSPSPSGASSQSDAESRPAPKEVDGPPGADAFPCPVVDVVAALRKVKTQTFSTPYSAFALGLSFSARNKRACSDER